MNIKYTVYFFSLCFFLMQIKLNNIVSGTSLDDLSVAVTYKDIMSFCSYSCSFIVFLFTMQTHVYECADVDASTQSEGQNVSFLKCVNKCVFHSARKADGSERS